MAYNPSSSYQQTIGPLQGRALCMISYPPLSPIILISAQYIVIFLSTAISSCPSGTQAVFLMQHNTTVGKQIRTIPTVNLGECSDHCTISTDCTGIEFSNANCMVFGEGKETPTEGSKILSKSCVKVFKSFFFHSFLYYKPLKTTKALLDDTHDPHQQLQSFEYLEITDKAQRINEPVIDARSTVNRHVCMAACLNSFDTFGFECESVMYYEVDQECILNTEDRLDRLFSLFISLTVSVSIKYHLTKFFSILNLQNYYVLCLEGKQLENELDRIINVDLDSCQSLCTQRLSLTVSTTNRCKYGNVGAKNHPASTYSEHKIPFIYYMLFSEEMLCIPPPETGDNFVCKSVMYYYNEQECILNAESRLTKPDLFISEGEEFQVDYFDITCHLESEKCPQGTHLKAVRTINAALPEGDGDLHVLKNAGTCNLLYLDGKTTLRPQVRQGVDLYDMHCLAEESIIVVLLLMNE
uniref:Apple domain-containing protein n=1 Tax=Heterorhabditis bacteriophora TaxID=37862 RepID=A0A1I7XHQ1_HETBA